MTNRRFQVGIAFSIVALVLALFGACTLFVTPEPSTENLELHFRLPLPGGAASSGGRFIVPSAETAQVTVQSNQSDFFRQQSITLVPDGDSMIGSASFSNVPANETHALSVLVTNAGGDNLYFAEGTATVSPGQTAQVSMVLMPHADMLTEVSYADAVAGYDVPDTILEGEYAFFSVAIDEIGEYELTVTVNGNDPAADFFCVVHLPNGDRIDTSESIPVNSAPATIFIGFYNDTIEDAVVWFELEKLPEAISIAAIPGVTVPATGETPVTTVTETDEYTGTVVWDPADDPFAAATAYTATITLSAKAGYTFDGVTVDFFTVAGATSVTNNADSGVVTAEFPATDAAPTFEIGDTGPAGGIIFYIDNSEPPMYPWTYLEAAPVTWWDGENDPAILWGNQTVPVPDTSPDMGTGLENTDKIVIELGNWNEANYAAKIVSELDFGGQTDWFLPSQDELDQMRIQLYDENLGDLEEFLPYWSSTDDDTDDAAAYHHVFYGNTQEPVNKETSTSTRVRPIRRF